MLTFRNGLEVAGNDSVRILECPRNRTHSLVYSYHKDFSAAVLLTGVKHKSAVNFAGNFESIGISEDQ